MIGFLNSASAEAFAHLTQASRDGLKEAGYVEGENVAIEYRWAQGQFDARVMFLEEATHWLAHEEPDKANALLSS